MRIVTVKKFWDFFDINNNNNDCKMPDQFLKLVKKNLISEVQK